MSQVSQNMTQATTEETPREFEARVMKARANQNEYITASEDIIKNYVPWWKPEDLYIIYKDVPVFAHGARDKWIEKNKTPLDARHVSWK